MLKLNGPMGNDSPISFISSGISGPWIVRALNKISVSPMNTLHVPRVTMNGGRLNLTIKKPFTAPAAVAAQMPRKMAIHGFWPAMGRTLDAVV